MQLDRVLRASVANDAVTLLLNPTTVLSTAMGTTTRIFIADPVKGWRRVPWNHAICWYIGAEALPAYAEQTIVVAFAHVEVDRHRVTQLFRLERARWRFDGNGRVDQAIVKDWERKRYWPASSSEVQERYSFNQTETDCIRCMLNI